MSPASHVGNSFEFTTKAETGAPGSVDFSASVTAPYPKLEEHLIEAFGIWLGGVADAGAALYEGVVENWENKPEFVKTGVLERGADMMINIGVDPSKLAIVTGSGNRPSPESIFHMLDVGTAPHTIETDQAAALLFRTPYRAKTKPRELSSGAGERGNTPWRLPHVEHRGTEAREFSKVIAEVMADAMEDTVTALIAAIVGGRSTPRQAAARAKASARRGISRRQTAASAAAAE